MGVKMKKRYVFVVVVALLIVLIVVALRVFTKVKKNIILRHKKSESIYILSIT